MKNTGVKVRMALRGMFRNAWELESTFTTSFRVYQLQTRSWSFFFFLSNLDPIVRRMDNSSPSSASLLLCVMTIVPVCITKSYARASFEDIGRAGKQRDFSKNYDGKIWHRGKLLVAVWDGIENHNQFAKLIKPRSIRRVNQRGRSALLAFTCFREKTR